MKQEIFNTVKTHLLQQNAKSEKLNPETNTMYCLYRGPNNTKCAVGCLIKDEFYTLELEGETANYSLVTRALTLSGIDLSDHTTINFLLALQDVHDEYPIKDWPHQLENIRKDYKLD